MIKTKIITRPKYENYEFEFDIERFSNQLNIFNTHQIIQTTKQLLLTKFN